MLDRVNKLSYIDRSMYNVLNPGDTICRFNYRPITTGSFETLVQYLWFIDNYQTGGSKVLYSCVSEAGSTIKYVMFTTTVGYGDWGMHDQISLNRSTYMVDEQSGIVIAHHSVVRTIMGRSN